MNITIELTGITPLADAINNLAEALKAGTKADEVIATAKTRAKKPKQEDAPTTTTPEPATDPAAPAATESATDPAPEKAPIQAQTAAAPTPDDVRKAVLAVAKEQGHDAASALLGKFGAKKLSEVKESDFAAIIAAAKGE